MWKPMTAIKATVVPIANTSVPRPSAKSPASIAATLKDKSPMLNRLLKLNAPVSRIIRALTKPVSNDTVLVCGRPHDLVQNAHPVGR
jgi:hypothetical protein